MLKMLFVILLIFCLAGTQIKAEFPATCSDDTKLVGCRCELI